MLSLLCFSVVLHLLSCCNAANSSNCENRCGNLLGSCLCYCELEGSLLATEESMLDLTSTFFPPEANPPEFVTVVYSFQYTNGTKATDDKMWYWSAQTSHFLHPFEVFQFLSLFFGKPEPYYTGDLRITLKAECGSITSQDINKLQLLTQRLKLYAERGNIGVILGDTYSAKAYNDKALKDVLERDTNRIINIIICTSIFVVFFSFVVTIILIITFFYSESHTKSKWIENVKEKKPVVLSLTVLSGIANAYITSLASSALQGWYNSSDKEDILHTFDTRINAAPLYTALFTDIIALILWILLVAAAGCTYCKKPKDDSESTLWCTLQYSIVACSKCCCKCCARKCSECCKCVKSKKIKHKYSYSVSKENTFIILSATVLCPIFCIIVHSPYIAIAYLNDGDHASSIFIYYMVLCYVLFGVIWLFFHWCQHFIDKDKNEARDKPKPNEGMRRVLGCCTIGEIESGKPNEATSKEQRHCFIIAVIILLFVALLFLLGLIVVISCYFVLIPINKSISNAPNRLLSIYQSGGFLIGSFIVFNILKYFHAQSKKKDIGENVDKIHVILHNWQTEHGGPPPTEQTSSSSTIENG